MNEKQRHRASKRLSLHLRHAPEGIGITLDPAGWVSIDELLSALCDNGLRLTRSDLDEVVVNNDKQRFAYDDSGTRIRASQGHSVDVELNLAPATPPDVLFHGTVERFIQPILEEGLRPMARRHVHLSAAQETALTVGARRGIPIIFRVDAAEMHAQGHGFRVSANGVWLAEHVPPEFLHRL